MQAEIIVLNVSFSYVSVLATDQYILGKSTCTGASALKVQRLH